MALERKSIKMRAKLTSVMTTMLQSSVDFTRSGMRFSGAFNVVGIPGLRLEVIRNFVRPAEDALPDRDAPRNAGGKSAWQGI